MSTCGAPGSWEGSVFPAASILSLCAAAATHFLPTWYPLHNDRILYAVAHLPVSFVEIALFFALVHLSRGHLSKVVGLESRPGALYLLAIAVIFAIFWLPVYMAGGFGQDDWLLLAAASTRKLMLVHPLLSWRTLDAVDGNFRPLGTVLYFGYMLQGAGLSAHAFTIWPFLLTLLASFVVFGLVRELGYSRLAAAAASLLFLSRGMIYTIVAWASALGDSIAILLCGLTALLILKANKRTGAIVFALHGLAWLCFAAATLAKQSAFVTPLTAALLLFLRPGQTVRPTLPRRILSAAAALLAYTSTAAFVFLHAKSLLRAPSPYLIDLSARSLFQSFSYATWYFLVLRLPDRFPIADLLPGLFGLVILTTAIVLARNYPQLLGDRPRDILFACLAALASLSLFIMLGTRSAPYYGSMAAFWFSIALAIVLTRSGLIAPHRRSFAFCLLLATGFAEIRLEQSALLPSGGYLWGTYGMDTERAIYASMQHELALLPGADTLVIADCPFANPYTSIALISAPQLKRILVVNTQTKTYLANDRQGLRPVDDLANLNDPDAYNWRTPLDGIAAARLLAQDRVLQLQCRDGRIKMAWPAKILQAERQ